MRVEDSKGIIPTMRPERRICLVGAGAIAATHAEVLLSEPGFSLAGVVDLNTSAGEKFAVRWGGFPVFASVDEALAQGGFDAVHILTPPDRRLESALPFLEAGVDTFCEKPLAASAREAETLTRAAAKFDAALGVNQNFVHAPAFVRMRARLESGEVGALRHLACIYRTSLRQLEARRFSAWMFRTPLNMLLEQAVHPLSQIHTLTGAFKEMKTAGAKLERLDGRNDSLLGLSALIETEATTVSLNFSVDDNFPAWRLMAFGTDGAIVADITENRCYSYKRSQWLEGIDRPLSAARTAAGLMGGALTDSARYALSQFRRKSRTDAFYRSMRASILTFHHTVARGGKFELDGSFGAALVRECERLATTIPRTSISENDPPRRTSVNKNRNADVALIGGSGFIGSHTLAALLEAGYSVSVMARHVDQLPDIFSGERVSLVKGDARRREDVERAVGSARYVVNLAHGGGGESHAEIADAMLSAAAAIADVCVKRNVERLIHISSIASLYLGGDALHVNDPTLPDPQADKRAPYARAKAETDRLLLNLHKTSRLPLVILRPGLVVGAGSSPFHSGLGFFNNTQHCVGWNEGCNPLPFVLAPDVGHAIVNALTAPDAIGRGYLLVGDVRPTAREYISRLAEATGRPLRFHPSGPTRLWLADMGKWAVKGMGGRKAPRPHRRDFRSRGLQARIDCAAAKSDLKWTPEDDPDRFYAEAFADIMTRENVPRP